MCQGSQSCCDNPTLCNVQPHHLQDLPAHTHIQYTLIFHQSFKRLITYILQLEMYFLKGCFVMNVCTMTHYLSLHCCSHSQKYKLYTHPTYWWTPRTSHSFDKAKGWASFSRVEGHISTSLQSSDHPTCKQDKHILSKNGPPSFPLNRFKSLMTVLITCCTPLLLV